MGKKQLGPDDWWAYQVFRTKSSGTEYIFCTARRRYGEDDIETVGHSEYFGVDRTSNYKKVTDKDPDSETFGQRIDDPKGDPIGTKMEFKYPYNEANKKLFKSMCSISQAFGPSQLYYLFKEKKISIPDSKLFWDLDWDEAFERFIHGKQTVVIVDEKNQRNTTRRRSKKT